MTVVYRDIVENTMPAFIKELVSLTLDGWAVSPTCPGDVNSFGNSFTVSMYRDVDTVEKLKSAAAGVNEFPKPTRAEILQKARDAKKAKLDVSTVK